MHFEEKSMSSFKDIFKNARVLITGGLGFIGSNLARRLVELGANVLVVDSLIPEYGGNLFNIKDIEDRITVNIADVRDPYSMKYLIKNRDYLFNLAGQTSHIDSMTDPFTDLEINIRAQLSILEACRHYNSDIKIVFASTRQIYGKPAYLPVDEKHPLSPVDANGINKMAGEQYHILYHNVYGLKTSVLRLTNTYGPRMRIKDARQTFLGLWIRLILEGKSFEVWGGEQLRDFTYIDDCVEALLLVASNEKAYGKIYNLGGKEVVSLRQLAEMLVKINKCGEYVIKQYPHDRKKIDIGDYYADYSLIRKDLNWKPKVSLEEGLKRTLNFYRKNLKYYVG
jgi:nucleoside-diphosphate-sugar epimerase